MMKKYIKMRHHDNCLLVTVDNRLFDEKNNQLGPTLKIICLMHMYFICFFSEKNSLLNPYERRP
jgi:hypothetical protein